MYKLIIEDDEGKTTVVPLIRDEITIGRKEGNTIRLTERNVSRKHARLLKQNGHVFIEDVNSYNGIKLNGDRIDGRATVGEGDRIQIGDYQLALKLDKGTGVPGQNGHGAPTGAVEGERTTPYMKDSAVPTQMIEAPTMMTQIAPPKAEAPGVARLVVVSSNFAGQEFMLDKAAVVIGRTDENDVVVNHRSISRHHAKIVRENGHYHVVDLQSANGVRVNGEEYGKVELRRGDHIDLGHVRMRFVAPGEDFVFERDAQVVDVAGRGGRSGVVIAIVAVLLIGGGVAAWRVIGGGGGPGTSTQPGAKTGDTEAQVNKLLMDADRAMKSEEWELAIAKCDEALKLDPTQELSRDKRQRAEAERKNRAAYQRFTSAAEKDEVDGAVAAYGEIAEDSIYRQRGVETYARVKKGFVRLHLDEAKKQKAANQCDAARQHVEAVMTVDESNQEALDVARSCGQVAARPVPSRPTPPERNVERNPERPVAKAERPAKKEPAPQARAPEPPPKKEPEESDTPPLKGGPDPGSEKALQEAQDAYVHGQYANAIELAKKAMKAQPGKAWRLIGASYCFLKDRGGAVTAFGRLDAQGKQFLKYVCSRNAITVP
jgi:pSer/pThr/pTyr-binding forkhead associated (FHA) protein